MKELTRRELLRQFFSKDTLKNFVGAYYHFSDSKAGASKFTCDDAGRMIGKNSKQYQNTRKEG